MYKKALFYAEVGGGGEGEGRGNLVSGIWV